MYKLGQNENLSAFEGSTLTQVCVGQDDIVLNFDLPNISVTAMCAVRTRDAGRTQVHEESRAASIALFDFLGRTVRAAGPTLEGGLLVAFYDGSEIELLDDSDVYESFWIKLGERLIIV